MIPYDASWVALSAAWSTSYNEHSFQMINYGINSLVLLMCFPHKINDVIVIVVQIRPFQTFYAVTTHQLHQ